MKPPIQHSLAVAGVLYSATMWGLFWYPFRLLADEGISGLLAVFIAYFLPLVVGIWWFGRGLWNSQASTIWMVVLGLASGWSNVGYVLGVLDGEVMRVLLLFYLSPLWTVLLARFFLHEHLNRLGWWVVVLSLAGAMVMLWRPGGGLPLPVNWAEWFGLTAGITFALSTVAGRYLGHQLSDGNKTVVVWMGVAVLTLLGLLFKPDQAQVVQWTNKAYWLLLGLGLAIGTVTFAVQYGIARLPSTQSGIIFLFELIVAAIAAYFLTDERMKIQEWIGAAMILAASLFSGRIQHHD